MVLVKEYWLDLREPRVVRRVVFRDADGGVEMDSVLDAHVRLAEGGPYLPTSISAEWPRKGASMRFRVRRWSFEPTVRPDGIQFATPRECATETAD